MNRNGKKKGAVAAPKRQGTGETLRVTGGERTEEDLQASQHLLKRVLFTAPVLFYIYDLVEQRNVYANRSVVDFLGYTADQIQAMGAELFSTILHPDDVARVARHHARMLTARDDEMLEVDYRMKHSGGQWRWLNSHDAVFLRNEQGQPRQILGASIDITERMQTAAALLESEERFRTVYERAAIGIAITDVQGRILQANAYFQRMLGRPSEDLVGRTTAEFTFPAEVETERALFHQAMKDGRIDVRIQKRYVRNDGQIIWANLTISICRNSSGQPQFVIGLIEDITARKLAETQIRDFSRKLLTAREEEKRHFSAALHHDVGSCTVGVTARLLAAEEDLRLGKYREALASLKEGRRLFMQSARRLKTLAAELRPPDLDILGLSAALRQHFSLLTKETSIRIRFVDATCGTAIPPEAQTVLYRVAQEALNNVILHARAHLVRVRVSAPRQTLRLSIIDDGKGFDLVKAAAKPGTHLGLRAAREMVEVLGGEFIVHSAPGRGTSVLATLPPATPQP